MSGDTDPFTGPQWWEVSGPRDLDGLLWPFNAMLLLMNDGWHWSLSINGEIFARGAQVSTEKLAKQIVVEQALLHLDKAIKALKSEEPQG